MYVLNLRVGLSEFEPEILPKGGTSVTRVL